MPREYRDRAPDVIRSLSVVATRLRAADILRVFAIVAPLSALAYVLLRRSGASLTFSALVAIAGVTVMAALWIARMRERWLPAAAARAIEIARPASRNVVITAEELLRHPDRAIPSIRARVLHESAEIAGAPGDVVPLQRQSVLRARGNRRCRAPRPGYSRTRRACGRCGDSECRGEVGRSKRLR